MAKRYESIVAADPNHTIAWNNLASCHLDLKDQRALHAAEAAHRLKPEDGTILDTLGVVQLRYGRADMAVQTLKKALLASL